MKDFARQQTMDRLEVFAKALQTATVAPETIHKVRVAARRFLQCLRTFAGQLDQQASKKVRARIRKLLDRCAAVRDRDIALGLLRDARGFKNSLAVRELSIERRNTESKLAEELQRWGKKDILRTWPERLFVNDAGNPHSEPDLSAMTAALFAEGQTAAAAGSSYEEMHQFRLTVKRYRYALEIFGSLYGDASIEPVLGGLRKLQNRLGAMNDCVTALELLRSHKRAQQLIRRMLAEREKAFRSHWKKNFGTRRRNQWTSIFCATEKQNCAPPPLRKQPARSLRRDAKTSAA